MCRRLAKLVLDTVCVHMCVCPFWGVGMYGVAVLCVVFD
jgi:hypothetical protein